MGIYLLIVSMFALIATWFFLELKEVSHQNIGDTNRLLLSEFDKKFSEFEHASDKLSHALDLVIDELRKEIELIKLSESNKK
jgi:hypothetical protein